MSDRHIIIHALCVTVAGCISYLIKLSAALVPFMHSGSIQLMHGIDVGVQKPTAGVTSKKMHIAHT